MEWCPAPDNSADRQYVALACHREMDDEHCVNQTYGGAALVQLWDVGRLDSISGCGSSGNIGEGGVVARALRHTRFKSIWTSSSPPYVTSGDV